MVWSSIQLLQRAREPKYKAIFYHKNMPVSGKDVNFLRLMMEKNEETKRNHVIDIRFHILMKILQNILLGVFVWVFLLLWLVLAVVGWLVYFMCSVVLHQHLSLLKE